MKFTTLTMSPLSTLPDKTTRKLSYSKDDREMRPIYIRALKISRVLTSKRLLFPKFVMGFCSDRH